MTRSFLFCVATERGLTALRAAHSAWPGDTYYVCTFRETGVGAQYYQVILDYCSEHSLIVVDWATIRSDGPRWLTQHSIFAIVCVGWRHVVPVEMLAAVERRVLVAHDSLLPRYRGFAPLATALLNGEDETGLTIFLADEGLDTGDVIYQERVPIHPDDTISIVHSRILPILERGIPYCLEQLTAKTLLTRPQDHSSATYSIWRDQDDYIIDWCWSAERIRRHILALGPPLRGACTFLDASRVAVHSARLVPDVAFEIRQPGKVWALDTLGRPTVVCGTGMIQILSATIADRSLLPMRRLRTRFRNA